MLEVINVEKNFKKKSVLKKINIKFTPGKVLGILGVNGVGKTTLLKTIFNDFEPSKGCILFDGRPFQQEDYLKMYYFTENNELPHSLTVKAYCNYILKLRYLGKITPVQIEKLKWIFKYEKLKKIKIDSLSAGEKKLLSLFLLFIIDPEIIFFDEPTANLDSNNKKILTAAIKHLKSINKTIVIITHLIEEVAELIDEVVIIKDGEVVFDKPTTQIENIKQTYEEVIGQVSDDKIMKRFKE